MARSPQRQSAHTFLSQQSIMVTNDVTQNHCSQSSSHRGTRSHRHCELIRFDCLFSPFELHDQSVLSSCTILQNYKCLDWKHLAYLQLFLHICYLLFETQAFLWRNTISLRQFNWHHFTTRTATVQFQYNVGFIPFFLPQARWSRNLLVSLSAAMKGYYKKDYSTTCWSCVNLGHTSVLYKTSNIPTVTHRIYL